MSDCTDRGRLRTLAHPYKREYKDLLPQKENKDCRDLNVTIQCFNAGMNVTIQCFNAGMNVTILCFNAGMNVTIQCFNAGKERLFNFCPAVCYT